MCWWILILPHQNFLQTKWSRIRIPKMGSFPRVSMFWSSVFQRTSRQIWPTSPVRSRSSRSWSMSWRTASGACTRSNSSTSRSWWCCSAKSKTRSWSATASSTTWVRPGPRRADARLGSTRVSVVLVQSQCWSAEDLSCHFFWGGFIAFACCYKCFLFFRNEKKMKRCFRGSFNVGCSTSSLTATFIFNGSKHSAWFLRAAEISSLIQNKWHKRTIWQQQIKDLTE